VARAVRLLGALYYLQVSLTIAWLGAVTLPLPDNDQTGTWFRMVLMFVRGVARNSAQTTKAMDAPGNCIEHVS